MKAYNKQSILISVPRMKTSFILFPLMYSHIKIHSIAQYKPNLKVNGNS